jgi:hypothetical protein
VIIVQHGSMPCHQNALARTSAGQALGCVNTDGTGWWLPWQMHRILQWANVTIDGAWIAEVPIWHACGSALDVQAYECAQGYPSFIERCENRLPRTTLDILIHSDEGRKYGDHCWVTWWWPCRIS